MGLFYCNPLIVNVHPLQKQVPFKIQGTCTVFIIEDSVNVVLVGISYAWQTLLQDDTAYFSRPI